MHPQAVIPRVCTVILNWNQPAMTVECARTALAQEVAGGQTVLVIDNGSTPENRVALRANLPAECVFIQNNRNLGFAGGMNVGIRYALKQGYDYVWLLNNDAFPEAGCLKNLVAALESDVTLGGITPSLIYPDGTPQLIGGSVNWATGELSFLMSGQLPTPTPPGYYATGAALLLRAAALHQVGDFDTRFFAYWEEVDLCVRLVRRGSWNLAEVPQSLCVHREAVSSGGSRSAFAQHLLTRNCFLLLRKHLPWRSLVPVYLRTLAAELQRAGIAVRDNPAIAAGIIGGVASGITRQRGRPRKLTAPGWFERLALTHWWGIGRALKAVANWITPRQPWPPVAAKPVGEA